MRKTYSLPILILTAILITSCGQGTPIPSTSEEENQPIQSTPILAEEPTQSSEGYPVEGFATATPFGNTQGEGYPAPGTTPFIDDLPDEITVPIPNSDRGIIIGQLLSPGPDGEPYYTTLYLVNTTPSDREGYPPFINFSEDDSPIADQDKLGNFLFVDVPPGIYALAIWSPISISIIQEPGSPDYILVEGKAGETTDLGIISIP